MKPEKTIQYRGHTIEIQRDEDAQSPQEGGDPGLFLIATHRQFYVSPPDCNTRFDAGEVIEQYSNSHWIFPLEAYIHSGVVLALRGEGNFADRQWDLSQCGAVFCSKSEWPEEDKARAAALSHINEWNTYLSGDVWGYVVGDDSCWGFYGMEYCIEAAKGVVDCQCARELREKLDRLKAWIINRVPLDKRRFTA